MLKVSESGKRADIAEATDHVPAAMTHGDSPARLCAGWHSAPAGFYFDARDAPLLSGAQSFVFLKSVLFWLNFL